MTRTKVAVGMILIGYVGGVVASFFFPAFLSLLIPLLLGLLALAVKPSSKPNVRDILPAQEPVPAAVKPAVPAPAIENTADKPKEQDPEWAPVLEYLGVIEEIVISEGQKNNLDNEIVDKALSLLARISRLIPQLKEMNDGNINHNIQRLVFKDLNGAINPFLKLSGDAKRQNRRLLLNGLKDINSKLSFYVETIEQKDLLELQTKVDLIHQRYNTIS